MKPTVGLWIDHRKAVIVVVSERGEETTQIESHIEKQPGRVAGVRSTTPYESQHVPADDIQQRKLTGHLNEYYDEVVSFIHGAESILLFGPGEAKDELNKRLKRDDLGGLVVEVQTVDRMTDREIAAKIRGHFRK
jgi:hypothetical protein